MPLHERDLVPSVAGHFEALGYRVFAEVEIARRWADLVAITAEEMIAVEMKLSSWREAFRQAIAYQLAADRAYVALPLSEAQRAHRSRFKFEQDGVGLLAVVADGNVRSVLEATPSPRRMPCLADHVRWRLDSSERYRESSWRIPSYVAYLPRAP